MIISPKAKTKWETFKKMNPQQRWQYFCDYYLVATIICIVTVSIFVSIFFTAASKKETILCGVLLNSDSTLQRNDSFGLVNDEFLNLKNRDPHEHGIEIITNLRYTPGSGYSGSDNYYSLQAISALISTNDLDFMIGSTDSMLSLAYADFFDDLSLLLSSERFEIYKPYFLYIDMAVVRDLQNSNVEDRIGLSPEFPDMAKPENMIDPVPIFIDLGKTAGLSPFYSNNENLVFALAAGSHNQETALGWLEFILDNQKTNTGGKTNE